MEQKLIKEVNKLKQRMIMLEKTVTNLIEIEEVNPKNLTKDEKKNLRRTLKNINKGKFEKFISLEDLKKKIE